MKYDGRKVGEIHFARAASKTHKARTVGLEVSPALHKLLSAMRRASRGKGSAFGLTAGVAEAAAKRMKLEYGAPKIFTWQALRRTCGTYLTSAGGSFGAASAYCSAKQLGHSVAVAERVRGIARDARTLGEAMQITGQLAKVVARVVGPVGGAAAVGLYPGGR